MSLCRRKEEIRSLGHGVLRCVECVDACDNLIAVGECTYNFARVTVLRYDDGTVMSRFGWAGLGVGAFTNILSLRLDVVRGRVFVTSRAGLNVHAYDVATGAYCGEFGDGLTAVIDVVPVRCLERGDGFR